MIYLLLGNAAIKIEIESEKLIFEPFRIDCSSGNFFAPKPFFYHWSKKRAAEKYLMSCQRVFLPLFDQFFRPIKVIAIEKQMESLVSGLAIHATFKSLVQDKEEWILWPFGTDFAHILRE